MKSVCFAVYSEKGHSAAIAEKIKKVLADENINTEIKRFRIKSEKPLNAVTSDFSIIDAPEGLEKFSLIVFVSFVTGFMLNPVMAKYLSDIEIKSGMPCICIAAKQFKSRWTGGNQAVNKMKKLCSAKGMKVVGSGIFSRKMENYDELIKDQADMIRKVLG